MPVQRPSVRDVLSKARARFKTRGAAEVWGTITGRVRGSIASGEELIFLTRAAIWDGEVARRTDEPLALTRASADDADDYERFIGTDSARTFAKRLSDETSCWFVRGRGAILHATWTTTAAAWTREIQRFFVSPPGAAYVYESFTRPEARGLGVYPFALVAIGERLAMEGIDTLFIGVEAGNAPSIRAISKAGFEPAFTLRYRRRFGRLTLDAPSGPRPDLARECIKTNPLE